MSIVLVPSLTVHSHSYCCPGPLCNEPVPIPPGEDPNLRMERHLSTDCSVMTGRSQKASATPRCGRPKCGKLLFAPIQCNVSSFFATYYWSFDPLFSVEMPSEILPRTSFPEFTQLLFDLIDCVASRKRLNQTELPASGSCT